MASPSRIDVARRKLRVARMGIGAVAAAGLAVFAFAARASHPGAANPSTPVQGTAAAAATGNQAVQSSGFGFDSGSISPGTGSPSVQSGGS